MSTLVIDCADQKDKLFNKPLLHSLHKLTQFEVQGYEYQPKNMADHTAVIISGVPTYYSLETLYDRNMALEWIFQLDIPVLGICLGHQMIGHRFGAQVISSGEEEVGLKTIEVCQEDDIFLDMPTFFNAQMLHTASIELPEEFTLLGRSDQCKNEMMRHKSRNIYSTQFHPELSRGNTILRNFLRLTQPRVALQA